MDFQNAPLSAKLTLPVLVLASVAYAAAPTLGKRHVTNTGEITKCEAAQAAKARLDFEREAGSLKRQMAPMPNLTLPKIGDLVEGMLKLYPGGEEFCRVHGCKRIDNALPKLELPNPAKEAADAAKSELQALNQSFKLNIASGMSRCECAARQAINDGHLPLTVFVATGGLVRTGPVADWQAAMRKAMQACREVTQ